MSLNNLSLSQKQRLAYIDFKLMFVGHFSRAEIVSYFEKGLTSATRDINTYKSLRSTNLLYDTKQKRYYQTAQFSPLFSHDPKKTLIKLSHQITDGLDAVADVVFPVNAPSQLNTPDIFVVAKLVQAILNNKVIKIEYTSLSSGTHSREIIPHNVVDNGLRWHIRGFDRKSSSFRDFVITRITKAQILDCEVTTSEEVVNDDQWLRKIPLQLVPHPHNVKFPKAICLDYGMQDGVLSLNVSAALVGYLLRRWNVDCTVDAELMGSEYQLWLRNRQTLFGAENLHIAPGYVPELEEL